MIASPIRRCPPGPGVRVVGAMLALLAAAGCTAPDDRGGVASQPTATASGSAAPARDLHAELVALASYDRGVDLGVDQTVAAPDPYAPAVQIDDISWLSVARGRVSAWLVRPPATVAPPYAGLVYLHGSETDRDDLRDEAVAMAQVGAVSIVLDAPFARPSASVERTLQSYGEPELERDMMAHAVIDVREAYDVLAARSDVDPARLGFVGHSWGASIGVDVAAVDDRPVALALLSPRPSWTGFLRDSTDAWVQARRRTAGEAAWARYLDVLAPFDPLAQVDRIDGDELLLQYGESDDVVPPRVAAELVSAAPVGAVSQTFPDAGHALDADATEQRCAWLSVRLGLPGVPADVLAAVGLPDE